MAKILLACGGTGGHIYPAVALADALKQLDSDVDIVFVGNKHGMEADIIPKLGYRFEPITIRGINRKCVFNNLPLPWICLKAIWRARKIIKAFRPQVVVGTGGYACFPTLCAAYMQNIPIVIHEQNSVAGLSNRLSAGMATAICTGYQNVKFLTDKYRTVFTGNPVRGHSMGKSMDRQEALDSFNFVHDKKCLLIMSGSGGASQLNAVVARHLVDFEKLDIQLIWITGKNYFSNMQVHMEKHRYPWVRCYPYLEDVRRAYIAADVVVSRAGALSIAELAVAEKPMILVPSPHVVKDHQRFNSLPRVDRGAALCVLDRDCPTLLLKQTIHLLFDYAMQRDLVENLADFSKIHRQACEKILGIVGSLTQPRLLSN